MLKFLTAHTIELLLLIIHKNNTCIQAKKDAILRWITYEAIGEPTVADAILDRIVHTAHQIELTGESVRKIMGNRK